MLDFRIGLLAISIKMYHTNLNLYTTSLNLKIFVTTFIKSCHNKCFIVQFNYTSFKGVDS